MSRLLRGTPQPLGANWDGHGVNFALFSANAEKVELCLFDADGDTELERIELEPSDDVWHGYLTDCKPGSVYAFRVHGPYSPDQGHRFNAHKLLLDPYVKDTIGKLHWNDAVYGYSLDDSSADLSFNEADSAKFVPKAVVVDEAFDWKGDQPPAVPWAKTIIYETHVRGFSRLQSAIDEGIRGSYAGLASEPSIAYLKSLGITSIELLPVQAFIDDHFLVNKGKVNYWGYNTISFFSVESRYLSTGDRNEFKEMVRKLHAAGIEVILDVVYNHTAEGGQTGPTLSFRGIDNTSYYRLAENDKRTYVNDSGCGNSLNLNHPQVLEMVIDSLKYWVNEMHVDGFRFDLAVSLGREAHGFDSNSEFFQTIRNDPDLSKVKLIAEPWDIGPGGYQLGAFPDGWAEWNDRFRDSIRRFWHGDAGMLPQLARCLHGSNDLFGHNNRRPSASINLITSHDGFTLADLLSYKHKHNEANGEDNRDGHNANFSDNYGVEGLTDDVEIIALRKRQARNLLATMFLAQGTPMLLAGDEMGRSQQGNNNAYCQDNELTAIDWAALHHEQEQVEFVKQLIRIRNAYPLLHRDRFVHGDEQVEKFGFNDIQWLRADGNILQSDDWHQPDNHFLAMLLAGKDMPARNPMFTNTMDAALIIVLNAGITGVNFVLPETRYHWHCVFTTAESDPNISLDNTVAIEPRTVQLFELQSD